MKQTSVWEKLVEALQVLFKNYLIFVPILIGIIFGLIISPLYMKLIFSSVFGGLSMGTIALFVFFYLVMIAIGLIMYGWIFNLIKQAVKKKKLNLKETLKESPSLAWKLFKVGLLVLVLAVLVGLAVGLIFVIMGMILGLIPILGALLGFILTAGLFVLFLIVYFALFHLIPILILEDLSAWQSLKLNYQYFMKNKLLTVKMGGISLLLFFVAYLPIMIYTYGFIGVEGLNLFIMENPVVYSIISIVLSIPVIIAFIGIFMFYTLVYLKNK